MGLQFPALGSTVVVPLFEGAEAGSDAADVRLVVRLVGAGKARSWSLRVQGIQQRDARAVAELRKGTTAETAPMLWRDGITTEQASIEMLAAHRDVLAETLAGVRGLRVGDRDLEAITDSAQLVDALDQCGLSDRAVLRAIEAQSPSIAQLFSSGS